MQTELRFKIINEEGGGGGNVLNYFWIDFKLNLSMIHMDELSLFVFV